MRYADPDGVALREPGKRAQPVSDAKSDRLLSDQAITATDRTLCRIDDSIA